MPATATARDQFEAARLASLVSAVVAGRLAAEGAITSASLTVRSPLATPVLVATVFVALARIGLAMVGAVAMILEGMPFDTCASAPGRLQNTCTWPDCIWPSSLRKRKVNETMFVTPVCQIQVYLTENGSIVGTLRVAS